MERIEIGTRLVGQFEKVHDGKAGADKWQVTVNDRGAKVVLQPLREQEELVTEDASRWLVVVGDSRFVSPDKKFRIHAVILIARKPSQRMVFCQTETPDGGTEWSHTERRSGMTIKTIASHASEVGPSVEEPAWFVDVDPEPRIQKGNFMLFVAHPVRPAETQPVMRDGVFEKSRNPSTGKIQWQIETFDRRYGITYIDAVARDSISPTAGRSWRFVKYKEISRARNGKRVVTLVRLVGPTPIHREVNNGLDDGISRSATEPKADKPKAEARRAKPVAKDALAPHEALRRLQMAGAVIEAK